MRELVVLCVVAFSCGKTEPVEPPVEPEPPATIRDAKPTPTPTPTPKPKPTPKPVTKPEPTSATECVETFRFDSDASVLDEQRGRGGSKRWDDFATHYAAAYIDLETDHPVQAVEAFTVGKTPLLWFRSDFASAVVNAAVLSELQVVDVTGLAAGKRSQIGTLGPLGQGKIGGRALLHFLMRADVIQTYVHIGSTVCLLSESDDERGYMAQLSGEHVYFTNEENRDAFRFSFVLGPDGVITVTGD